MPQRQPLQPPPAHGDFEYGDNGEKKKEEKEQGGVASCALELWHFLQTPLGEIHLREKALTNR